MNAAHKWTIESIFLAVACGSGTSLSSVGDTTAPCSVNLINGAQAKNIFWQVGNSTTINGAGGGTIIASAGVTFSAAGNVTVTTLNGRAL